MHKPTLLQLGGSHFQIPLILKARALGLQTVLCDRNENCPGRIFADDFVPCSVQDVEAVYGVASKLGVCGISAYACDPGAFTAAVVSERLRLPGHPSTAVQMIARKDLFREFLRKNGFAAPRAIACNDITSYYRALDVIGPSSIVKPVDASGSKGVSLIDHHSADPGAAYSMALEMSSIRRVIVEEVIQHALPQIAGDGFVQNGELTFACFGDENFDTACSPVAPIAETFPGHLSPANKARLLSELDRLVQWSGLLNGAINFDVVIDEAEQVHFLDLGPRSGGNGIPELLNVHTGENLIEASILASVGETVKFKNILGHTLPDRCHATYVIHATQSGILQSLNVDNSITRHIMSLHFFDEFVGKPVKVFSNSSDSLGYALLEFDNRPQMLEMIKRLPRLLRPVIRHERA